VTPPAASIRITSPHPLAWDLARHICAGDTSRLSPLPSGAVLIDASPTVVAIHTEEEAR
jgi:hypothetical protein